MTRQEYERELAELASEIMDARPGLTAAAAVRLAAASIQNLQQFRRQWDRSAALAYALRQPLARTA